MKTTLVSIGLIVAVALALRLGYVAGCADGWQLGRNEIETAIALRDRLPPSAAPYSAEAIAAQWQRVTADALARDQSWRTRRLFERLETPRPIWRLANPPAEFVRAAMLPPIKFSPAHVLPLFPFSQPAAGKERP